jgi:hypothetical protein
MLYGETGRRCLAGLRLEVSHVGLAAMLSSRYRCSLMPLICTPRFLLTTDKLRLKPFHEEVVFAVTPEAVHSSRCSVVGMPL